MTASEKAAHEFMRTAKADKVIAIHGNVIARKCENETRTTLP